MKKVIFTLVLINFYTVILAQEWAPTGTIWHYSQSTLNPNLQSYKTIESVGDTVFQNKTCRKMFEITRYIVPISHKTYLMYSINDSVFYYEDLASRWCLLYLFNAQAGDTIYLDCFNLKVSVDFTDTITYNSQLRRVQYISSNNFGANFWGTNIEGIGNNIFMFPQGDMYTDGPLRCFQDSSGLIKFTTLSCDIIINSTSINSYSPAINFSLSPNPFSQSTQITLNQTYHNIALAVYDIQGKQVAQQQYANCDKIQFSRNQLSNGLYFLKLTLDDKAVETGKIMISD